MAGDALVPSENWVDNQDPDYDEACPTCSALVENRAVHRAFHLAIVERADRHVPEPRYG